MAGDDTERDRPGAKRKPGARPLTALRQRAVQERLADPACKSEREIMLRAGYAEGSTRTPRQALSGATTLELALRENPGLARTHLGRARRVLERLVAGLERAVEDLGNEDVDAGRKIQALSMAVAAIARAMETLPSDEEPGDEAIDVLKARIRFSRRDRRLVVRASRGGASGLLEAIDRKTEELVLELLEKQASRPRIQRNSYGRANG